MAFISNVSYSAGKGQIWKTGIPLKSCQLEGFWLEDGPHKPWFEEGFLLEYMDNTALWITIGKNYAFKSGAADDMRRQSATALAKLRIHCPSGERPLAEENTEGNQDPSEFYDARQKEIDALAGGEDYSRSSLSGRKTEGRKDQIQKPGTWWKFPPPPVKA